MVANSKEGVKSENHLMLPDRSQYARFFQIAGLTIRVQSDLPITTDTFAPKLKKFMVAGPGSDPLSIQHHFYIPELKIPELGREFYRKAPWAIYCNEESWTYLGISSHPGDQKINQIGVFNLQQTKGEIYNLNEEAFRRGNVDSLTLFPTDQLWLARLLADWQACYLHAAGMIIDGQGFLFVGHSEAGKSTIVTLLQEHGEILCDERIIVRRWAEGFRMHGTWSHGDVPAVSPASAGLRAILFLEQAPHNRLIRIEDRWEIIRRVPFFVVRPLITAKWWEKTLDLVGMIAREVPVYRLQFDRSGEVLKILREL